MSFSVLKKISHLMPCHRFFFSFLMSFITGKSALTHTTFPVHYFIWGTRNPILCQQDPEVGARTCTTPFTFFYIITRYKSKVFHFK